MAQTISISDLEAPRQGASRLRKPASLSVGKSGLILWTRWALLRNAGALLREVKDSVVVIPPNEYDEITVDPIGETYILKGDRPHHGARVVRYALSVNGRDAFMAPELSADSFVLPGVCYVAFTKIQCYSIDKPAAALVVPTIVTSSRTIPAPGAVAVAGFNVLGDHWLGVNLDVQELFEADYNERIVLRALAGANTRFEARIPLSYDPSRGATAHVSFSTELRFGFDLVDAFFETSLIRPKLCMTLYAWDLSRVNFVQSFAQPVHMKTIVLADTRKGREKPGPGSELEYPLRDLPTAARDKGGAK